MTEGSRVVAIVGFSPGNTYFTERVIHLLLDATTKAFPRVVVVIPEVPDRYNYLDKGRTDTVARRKARKNARKLVIRFEAALLALPAQQRERIRRIPWDGVSEGTLDAHPAVVHARKTEVDALYASCKEFVRDVNAVASGVAENYILDELAVFCAATALLDAEKCVIIYHKDVLVLSKFIAGAYSGARKRDELAFLRIEVKT